MPGTYTPVTHTGKNTEWSLDTFSIHGDVLGASKAICQSNVDYKIVKIMQER
jgi:hypothetical protein